MCGHRVQRCGRTKLHKWHTWAIVRSYVRHVCGATHIICLSEQPSGNTERRLWILDEGCWSVFPSLLGHQLKKIHPCDSLFLSLQDSSFFCGSKSPALRHACITFPLLHYYDGITGILYQDIGNLTIPLTKTKNWDCERWTHRMTGIQQRFPWMFLSYQSNEIGNLVLEASIPPNTMYESPGNLCSAGW